jgi:hypothetical protein
MWIKTSERLPIGQKIYEVYGTLNIGFENECKDSFQAKWNSEEYGWSDEHAESISESYHRITHWFDFSTVGNPSNLL